MRDQGWERIWPIWERGRRGHWCDCSSVTQAVSRRRSEPSAGRSSHGVDPSSAMSLLDSGTTVGPRNSLTWSFGWPCTTPSFARFSGGSVTRDAHGERLASPGWRWCGVGHSSTFAAQHSARHTRSVASPAPGHRARTVHSWATKPFPKRPGNHCRLAAPYASEPHGRW